MKRLIMQAHSLSLNSQSYDYFTDARPGPGYPTPANHMGTCFGGPTPMRNYYCYLCHTYIQPIHTIYAQIMTKRTQEAKPLQALLKCADLVLPYLTPPELAATSSTCWALHVSSKSISAVRSSDAARGLEILTVPFLNPVDSQPYVYFAYAPSPVRSHMSLLKCADLILPYLTPPELAATSSTCWALHVSSKSISAVRSSDAARGFEILTVPFLNPVDSQPYVYFAYAPSPVRVIDPTRARQVWGARFDGPTSISKTANRRSWDIVSTPSKPDSTSGGCECGSFCGDECPCGELSCGELTWECGPSCACEVDCGNRVSQGGLKVKVKVVKDEKKGWGLVAAQEITHGEFVCEYAGELLTTEEARKRQQKYDQLSSSGRFSSALLVIREHLPSRKACIRINIDATIIGNVARFINHSCDGGNLTTVLVRSSGEILPRLCFFASRDIKQDEELCFSYGETRVRSNGLQCFCGSSCCSGRLPSENT